VPVQAGAGDAGLGAGVLWLESAREQYAALPADVSAQVEVRVEKLLQTGRRP
jgi:hypothetical protein